jgi:hypothetical protein
MNVLSRHRCYANPCRLPAIFGIAGWTAILILLCSAIVSSARTIMDSNPAQREPSVSNVFHREFDATDLGSQERVVILVCASDGAVVSVNGNEAGRVNMPPGAIDGSSLAAVADSKDKGLYYRIRVPAQFIHPGINSIDADVHSGVAGGSTLSCDLLLKTLPALRTQPAPDEAARSVLEEFRQTSYIPAGTLIPDGYIDGGHGMRLDAADHATSGREILVVDRPLDPELQMNLAYARTLRSLDPLERAHKLSLYLDQLATPPGGLKVLDDTITQLQKEFQDQPLCIGDVLDQSHAGVCRHRSLLFKILADEAGLKTALVRGNYFHAGEGEPHAWNELLLDDGRRFLVDSTLHPKDEFPEITSPAVTPASVAKHYVKLDNTPYYKST